LKEIHTEIDIGAPVEKVWDLLTDFKNFELWNPFIRKIEELQLWERRSKYIYTLLVAETDLISQRLRS
jgi:uncharacterized membrane protein